MHTKLNYTQAAALFAAIAAKHKAITYFVELDFYEIKEIVKTPEPALLLTGFKESLSGYRFDNNQSGKRFYFGIVKYYASKATVTDTPHSVIDECRELCIDVISWLRNEKRSNRLNGFEPDSVGDGEAIIMKDDGFYGWEFSLTINTPINLAFAAEKWNE